MTDSIYKPSDDVIIAALEDAGVPSTLDPDNLPDKATLKAMRAVLDKTVKGWKDFIDGQSVANLNGALFVNVANKGRRITIANGEDTGIKVRVESRSIDRTFIRRRIREEFPFFKVKNIRGKMYLSLGDDVGTITKRAVAEFYRQTGLGTTNNNYNIGDWAEDSRLSQFAGHLMNLEPINTRTKMLVYARQAFKRGMQVEDVKVEKIDTGPQFEKFMRDKRDSLRRVGNDKSIELLPVPAFDVDMAASRTWGIEIESGGARGVRAPDDWDRKYDGSLHSAYNGSGTRYRHIEPEDCDYYMEHREEVRSETGEMVENPEYLHPDDCDYCGDVEVDYDDYDDYDDEDDDCAEFVSGILDQFHERGMRQLTEDLSQEPQNDSAGVHVHVEARDLTPKQIGGLTYAYQIIEPLIEDAYKREVRNYCKVRSQAETLKVIRSGKTAKALTGGYREQDDGKVLYHGDRYVSVNLNSLNAHGTVEFRAMGPVYEYDHLIRWALFCREMVNVAKKNLPAKVWNGVKNWDDVVRILVKYGEELPAIKLAEIEANQPAEELVLA